MKIKQFVMAYGVEQDRLRAPEPILSAKEFCDCRFRWMFSENDAGGVSLGMTLPAYPEEVRAVYPKQPLTAANAAAIPCRQALGTYKVIFDR